MRPRPNVQLFYGDNICETQLWFQLTWELQSHIHSNPRSYLWKETVLVPPPALPILLWQTSCASCTYRLREPPPEVVPFGGQQTPWSCQWLQSTHAAYFLCLHLSSHYWVAMLRIAPFSATGQKDHCCALESWKQSKAQVHAPCAQVHGTWKRSVWLSWKKKPK